MLARHDLVELEVQLRLWLLLYDEDDVLWGLFWVFGTLHTMVVHLKDLPLGNSDLVYFEFSLAASRVGVQHSQLHFLRTLRPNVEIVQTPHLPQQYRSQPTHPFPTTLGQPSQVDDCCHCLTLHIDLLDKKIAAVAGGKVEGVMVECKEKIIFRMAKRSCQNELLPMFPMSELDGRIGSKRDVVHAECVVQDGCVVYELFGELRPIEPAVVLEDRDLLRLHDVQVLPLHPHTQNLGDGITAETGEVELPLGLLHGTPTEYNISYFINTKRACIARDTQKGNGRKGDVSFFVLLSRTLLFEEVVLVLLGCSRYEIFGLLHGGIGQIQQILLFYIHGLLLGGIRKRIGLLRDFSRSRRRSLHFLHRSSRLEMRVKALIRRSTLPGR